ncbi:MAG: matrixin family metalloprotease [Acidimicrobiia bacterium]|nr:matrixin family metalloprotease [Acidimicrobiia bacterium]
MATGLDLVYVGETTAGLDGRPPLGADAVFAFTTEAALQGAVGLGGGWYYPATAGDGRVVEGFALFASLPGSYPARDTHQRDLFLHEIGHMLGLGHVAFESQVMYPYVRAHADYQYGDRNGLWRLGAAHGCVAAGGALAAGVAADPGPGPGPGAEPPVLLTAVARDHVADLAEPVARRAIPGLGADGPPPRGAWAHPGSPGGRRPAPRG